jgi:hypothetical protein
MLLFEAETEKLVYLVLATCGGFMPDVVTSFFKRDFLTITACGDYSLLLGLDSTDRITETS